MNSPFKISPFFTDHIDFDKVRSSRQGNTIYVTGEQGNYEFHDSPQYDGHEPSSHLMADDNRREAWPSIYRDSITGVWSNQSRDQAIKRNELYSFKDQNEMIDFAREGNWKNK
jgi:hypothetical protein